METQNISEWKAQNELKTNKQYERTSNWYFNNDVQVDEHIMNCIYINMKASASLNNYGGDLPKFSISCANLICNYFKKYTTSNRNMY